MRVSHIVPRQIAFGMTLATRSLVYQTREIRIVICHNMTPRGVDHGSFAQRVAINKLDDYSIVQNLTHTGDGILAWLPVGVSKPVSG